MKLFQKKNQNLIIKSFIKIAKDFDTFRKGFLYLIWIIAFLLLIFQVFSNFYINPHLKDFFSTTPWLSDFFNLIRKINPEYSQPFTPKENTIFMLLLIFGGAFLFSIFFSLPWRKIVAFFVYNYRKRENYKRNIARLAKNGESPLNSKTKFDKGFSERPSNAAKEDNASSANDLPSDTEEGVNNSTVNDLPSNAAEDNNASSNNGPSSNEIENSANFDKEYRFQAPNPQKKRNDPYYGRELPRPITSTWAFAKKENVLKEWQEFFDSYPGKAKKKFDIIEDETRWLTGWDETERADLMRTSLSEYCRMLKEEYGPSKVRKNKYPGFF